MQKLRLTQADAAPKPFVVKEGEWLVLVTRFSADGVTVQFQLERENEVPDVE